MTDVSKGSLYRELNRRKQEATKTIETVCEPLWGLCKTDKGRNRPRERKALIICFTGLARLVIDPIPVPSDSFFDVAAEFTLIRP